jgi:hypothetical protein
MKKSSTDTLSPPRVLRISKWPHEFYDKNVLPDQRPSSCRLCHHKRKSPCRRYRRVLFDRYLLLSLVVLYFFGFKFLKTRFGNFSWLQNPCLPGLSHAWLTRWQLRFPQEEFFSVMFQRNLLLRISDVQALCFFQFWQQQHNTTTTDILSVFYYTFMVASLKSQKVKNEKKFNRHFVSP